MQLSRADFRNPIGRGIVQLTDPLIRPLRRVLPPAGRVDTASVVAVVLFAAAKIWLLRAADRVAWLSRHSRCCAPRCWRSSDLVLKTYLFSIVLNAILSFVAPGNYSPAQSLLASHLRSGAQSDSPRHSFPGGP